MASLAILQTYTAVANSQGLTVPFGATGGSSPYFFQVLPGGAGGSINGSTGLYTAPSTVGVDQIQVTDSTSPAALTAVGSVAVLTSLQLVADIIKTSMNLQGSQVYLYDQKYNIPTDSKLYIAVGVNSLKPFGNRPKFVSGSTSFVAQQTVNIVANLSIHILSRSTDALFLKEQVLLALSSPYAEQQMELNSFFIAPVTTGIVDISDVDGAAIPYHFVFSVNLQYFSALQTSPSYFGTFSDVSVLTDVEPVVPETPAPGNFKILIASVEGSSIGLAWTISLNAGSYRVLRGTTSGIWDTDLGTTTANEFVDTSPDPNILYYYQVVAENDTGSTYAASEVSALVPAIPPPAAPSDLQVLTLLCDDNDNCSFIWTDNSVDETNFVFEKSLDGSAWTVLTNTLPPDTTFYAATGLSPWTVLYFRVGAENAGGTSYCTPLLVNFGAQCT